MAQFYPGFPEKKGMNKLWVRAVCWPPDGQSAAKGGCHLLILVLLLGIRDSWSMQILNLRV
ncbi:hypothetical protein AXF42_Ash001488 [Apostasia shenzhenica]|uniref:Uncharacterized protein n=1 Tax=Apostasia shenzhenica TaxID=1088818 RepID=A0A2I0AV12_9ASPA|nr:hypothetical protein AXF42_Ash001488 [Apostasia shenzhenica]